MAITHVTAVRNALADLIASTLLTGSAQEAQVVLRQGTTTIVTFDLAATPFGAASSGTITANTMPRTASATASGIVDNFQLKDQAGTVILTGTVTATGGGGDIEVSNTNIASGQDCSLESLTYTAPV
jgi:hypothetical protein